MSFSGYDFHNNIYTLKHNTTSNIKINWFIVANKRRRNALDSDSSCTSDQQQPQTPCSMDASLFLYPPSSKKPRMLFSEEQKEALKLAYTLDPYPSTAVMEFLSAELGLSVRTITNWFHNHRMRLKQQNQVCAESR